MTRESTMQKVDAMADFLAALDELGPRMSAIDQLCAAAVELERSDRFIDLEIQGLSREEYDSFDGEDRHFPPNKDRSNPFWSKRMELRPYDAGESAIVLTLYTDLPPVVGPPLPPQGFAADADPPYGDDRGPEGSF